MISTAMHFCEQIQSNSSASEASAQAEYSIQSVKNVVQNSGFLLDELVIPAYILLKASISMQHVKNDLLSHYLQHIFSSVTTAQSRRRFRTNFTENQSVALEEAFQESHYPDQNSKKQLSAVLDIPEDRITILLIDNVAVLLTGLVSKSTS
ncbi:unnamed protein product [Enterobius vermicularis]|uniref:Homeobox domain-containing protein n=1 Tax=Enterobius vermicularis TaxID=51028 RepID=A0A158QBA6_ENTVE|nr:unnamed protein product [Enterobius vermicularis]